MTEKEQAQLEDPEFAEVQARALARARGETFSTEKHMPPVYKLAPRLARIEVPKPPPPDPKAIAERFKEGPRRHLQAVPTRDFKQAAAGDA